MSGDKLSLDGEDDYFAYEIMPRGQRLKIIQEAYITSFDVKTNPRKALPILKDFARIIVATSETDMKMLLETGGVDQATLHAISTAVDEYPKKFKEFDNLKKIIIRCFNLTKII